MAKARALCHLTYLHCHVWLGFGSGAAPGLSQLWPCSPRPVTSVAWESDLILATEAMDGCGEISDK